MRLGTLGLLFFSMYSIFSMDPPENQSEKTDGFFSTLTALCSSYIGNNKEQFNKDDLSKLTEPCKKKVGDFITKKEIIPFLAPIKIPGDHKTVTTHKQIGAFVKKLSLSPDGRQLLGASEKGIMVWDLSTMEKIQSYSEEALCPCKMVVHNGSQMLACVENVIKIIDPKSGVHIASLLKHYGKINELALLNDNEFVSCSDDQSICLWDLRKQQVVTRFSDHTHHVMTIDAQEQKIISSSLDNTIRKWNLYPREEEHNEEIARIPARSYINSIRFFQGAHFAVTGGSELKVWDIQKKKCTRVHHLQMEEVCSVGLQLFASTAVQTRVYLWDPALNRFLACMDGHGENPRGICFVPESKTIISTGRDKRLCEWDVSSIIGLYDSLTLEERITLAEKINGNWNLSNNEKLELLKSSNPSTSSGRTE